METPFVLSASHSERAFREGGPEERERGHWTRLDWPRRDHGIPVVLPSPPPSCDSTGSRLIAFNGTLLASAKVREGFLTCDSCKIWS